jgi:Zn-dependent protease with chaperone function
MRLFKVFFALFVTVIIVTDTAFAQLEKNYTPLPVLDTIPKATADLLLAQLEVVQNRIPNPKSKAGVYAKALNLETFVSVIGNFNNDAFIAEGETVQKLRAIVAKISAANPTLANDVTIYIHRSSVPNAVTMSGGTVAITLGLLARLQSEDQLAFAICHELAHHYNRHQEIRVLEIARLNYDKALRRELNSIARSDYGGVTKATDLGLKLGLSITQHSRDKEFEADSVGLKLYLNAGFHSSEAVRLLEVLDSVDSDQEKMIDVKKYFNFTEYPFKDRWLAYDSTADGFERDDHEISDSLRTHPDCKKRIAALQRQLRFNDKVGAAVTEWPATFRKSSEFEMVASAFHYDRYALSAFKALTMLEEYPDNQWLHDIVGNSLNKIYKLQKDHQASRALPLPAPYYKPGYNHFIAFIHNLRLTEVESISRYYIENHKH